MSAKKQSTRTLKDLQNVFWKIRDAARDGQAGSAVYAMDRLAMIYSLAEAGLIKIDREGVTE